MIFRYNKEAQIGRDALKGYIIMDKNFEEIKHASITIIGKEFIRHGITSCSEIQKECYRLTTDIPTKSSNFNIDISGPASGSFNKYNGFYIVGVKYCVIVKIEKIDTIETFEKPLTLVHSLSMLNLQRFEQVVYYGNSVCTISLPRDAYHHNEQVQIYCSGQYQSWTLELREIIKFNGSTISKNYMSNECRISQNMHTLLAKVPKHFSLGFQGHFLKISHYLLVKDGKQILCTFELKIFK